MRRSALLRLCLLLIVGAAGVIWPPTFGPSRPTGSGDVSLYRDIVARLRHGEPYHAAVGAELRARGYASKEVFNWRTPLHLWLIARAGDAGARVALILLIVAFGVAAMPIGAPPGGPGWVASLLSVSGVVAVSLAPDLVWLSEAWAGLLIGLSICATVRKREALAAATGLMALFVREIAAPYCLVATIAAWRRRGRAAVAPWIAGGILYAAYYGLHLWFVLAARSPADTAHAASWIEFGGLPFLLATLSWCGWFFVVDPAWSAVALVLLTAGLMRVEAPAALRVAGAAFAVFFLVVGKPFDHYWGLVAGPMWSVCCAHGLRAVAEDLRGVTRRRLATG